MLFDNLYTLVNRNDLAGIRKCLAADPSRANKGIHCGNNIFHPKGHPLHRICDAVFAKKISDEQAITIAKLFLEFGADVNGYRANGDNNTPLIAAASLHAEQLGIFYIEQGADVFYRDANDGATALHWAAFCGRDLLVAKLIEAGAGINLPDTSFNSPPMGWAIHTLMSKDSMNIHRQAECVKTLLKAGADQSILGADAQAYLKNELKISI